MANTPHGSWHACPQFGIRDLLEEANARSEKAQVALDQINGALQDLGITNFRVETIARDTAAAAEVAQWTITLVSTADPGRTFSFGLGGKTPSD
jgi:hypothetical protein